MGGNGEGSRDPRAIVRTAAYRRLLVVAALVGFVVSLAAWAFLTLVPWIQDTVFINIPGALGFSPAPWWWPLPVLAIAGAITAFAITRLPGNGGSVPALGFGSGTTEPADLPGIVLAALATLGLGLVLGPSMPVIALGSGLAIFAVRKRKSDAPDEVALVMSAAGSFASFAMIFGSPVISAVILIEGAGLGGPTLPLIVLPGLLAAGIGSLVNLGMGHLTGLSNSAYALNPLELPAMPQLTFVDFLWTFVVASLAAVVTFAIVWAARRIQLRVRPRQFLLVPLSAVIVDDFHYATPAVSADMTDLVERWPAQTAQLVLSTRFDPPLRLHRLRMAGELCELRDRDLYFSLAETRDLLANFGVEVTAADLALLYGRSEGWAAALQMAALSLRGTPTRRGRLTSAAMRSLSTSSLRSSSSSRPGLRSLCSTPPFWVS
jgi:H+/Cl- antiporter ClcA